MQKVIQLQTLTKKYPLQLSLLKPSAKAIIAALILSACCLSIKPVIAETNVMGIELDLISDDELEKVKGISQSLLNIEDSIAAEMEE
jgi:hypothetical protein